MVEIWQATTKAELDSIRALVQLKVGQDDNYHPESH